MTNLELLQKAYKDALRDERRLTKAETAYWANQWQIIARSAIVELEKAQRTWVGLTQYEIEKAGKDCQFWEDFDMYEFADRLQLILKEKNT